MAEPGRVPRQDAARSGRSSTLACGLSNEAVVAPSHNMEVNMKPLPLVTALLLSNMACAADSGCTNAPVPVAACHTIHGRLNVYNGRWGAIIWVVGTKHYIGILDDKDGSLLVPSKLIFDRDDVVYGDFSVCPLVPPHQGHIEEVCVQSAKHLVVRHD